MLHSGPRRVALERAQMILYKIDVAAIAESLNQPFEMVHIARVDHFGVYLYLCEGAVAKHRHHTQDELFYVHTGEMALSTEWGEATLHAREAAVVPRGVSHVSASLGHERTVVMFFRAQGEPEKSNGHGRISAPANGTSLPKWTIEAEARCLETPLVPRDLLHVDEMSLRITWIRDRTPWHLHEAHDELLYVEEGLLDVETGMGKLTLGQGELLVVPRKTMHRLGASLTAISLSFIHASVGGAAHMGLLD